MTYRAKLIEKGSWCIFAEIFQCFHIYTKVWWPIEDQREFHNEH